MDGAIEVNPGDADELSHVLRTFTAIFTLFSLYFGLKAFVEAHPFIQIFTLVIFRHSLRCFTALLFR